MSDHSHTRRAFLAGSGGLLTTSLVGTPARAASALPKRPNFVFILADDLGWGEVGCYGQKMIDTPHIDRMAAQGLRFTSAYAGAPLCAPSRAALLTGLHNGHSTVRENPEGGEQHSMSSRDMTFASLLKLAGYRTACIGKWGFGPQQPGQPSHPNARGFGEFFGFIDHQHAHQYWPQYLWHNQRKVPLGGQSYAPDLFLDRAKTFLRESARSDEPFMLYFPTILPHSPSQVPGDAGEYQDEPWTLSNRRHAAQVTRLDDHVNELLKTLRETGLDESTIVVFAGDNGPHREKGVTPWLFNSNGPWRADKRDLYEGGIRIPFIVWGPSLPRKREVISEPVAFWDVLPTFGDMAGLPVPDRIDGRSFKGLLTGGDYEGHDYLFWNRPRKVQAIRRGNWKAVRYAPHFAKAGPTGRFELYDLDSDRSEQMNLSDERPEIVSELDALMNASVGPDPRLPYGLAVSAARATRAGRTREVEVKVHNGSAVTWDDLRVRLEAPKGWKVSGGGPLTALEAGTSATVVFNVTPPSRATPAATLVSTARFSAGRRKVRFTAKRRVVGALHPDV